MQIANISDGDIYVIDCENTSLTTHSCPPRWCRGSGLDCGSEDPGSIPSLPSPRVGPLMARKLKTSGMLCLCQGRLGTLKTPSCPRRLVPGSRSKFGNVTTVPSQYS